MNREQLLIRKKHINNIRRYLGIRASGSVDDEFRIGVREFQKRNDLPLTETVSFETFERMKAVYYRTNPKEKETLPQGIEFPISRGSVGKEVEHINSMLRELLVGYEYDGILPYGGLYDEKTARAVNEARRIFGLCDGADVDLAFYLRLSREIIIAGL